MYLSLELTIVFVFIQELKFEQKIKNTNLI